MNSFLQGLCAFSAAMGGEPAKHSGLPHSGGSIRACVLAVRMGIHRDQHCHGVPLRHAGRHPGHVYYCHDRDLSRPPPHQSFSRPIR